MAYAVDTVGRRKYTLKIRDLATGKDLTDEVKDVTGNHVWAADNKTLFYVRQDPQTLRWFQIYRHTIGTNPNEDALVYQEDDEEFSCYVSKSRSRKYILIESEQTLSSEYHYLDAATPDAKPTLFHAREADHEYSVDHLGDHFYIRSNWEAKNFRLLKCKLDATEKSCWETIVPHEDDVYLSGADLFDNFLVLEQRFNGLVRIRIRDWKSQTEHDLDFGEPCYLASTSPTPDPNTDWLRFRFSSMVTPSSTFEYQMSSREKKLLKQDEILGGFNSTITNRNASG